MTSVLSFANEIKQITDKYVFFGTDKNSNLLAILSSLNLLFACSLVLIFNRHIRVESPVMKISYVLMGVGTLLGSVGVYQLNN